MLKTKILSISLSTLLIVSTTLVVSCNIGELSSRNYLLSLNDFDWTGGPTSDGDWNNWLYNNLNSKYDEVNLYSLNNNVKTTKVNSINGPVDKIFDYDNYNTSYKGSNFITKQAVTGSPINKSYRPNGNYWSDFGISSRSRMYNKVNSILDWDTLQNDGSYKDLDLKYNISNEDLQPRNFVAKSEVHMQQHVKKENNRVSGVFYNEFRDPSKSSSSVVGTKNAFNGNSTNIGYIHQYITWPSIKNTGWITPPPSDWVNALHRNGVPAFGLLYLSGWEDVNRKNLADMLKTDSTGNYLIVDVLINMALIYNFDGWFFNNEANGSMPDGYSISNDEVNKILVQFNKEAKKIYDQTGKFLQIIYYTNDGSVQKQSNGTWKSKKTLSALAIDDNNIAQGASELQLDFENQYPGNEEAFINQYGQDFRRKLYSMYYDGNFLASLGNYDIRNYIYKKNSMNEFSDEPSTSFSSFGWGSPYEYTKTFYNKLNSSNGYNNRSLNWLMGQELSDLYNNLQFTGSNGYIESEPVGSDIRKTDTQQPIWDLIQNDPRISADFFSDDLNITQDFQINSDGQFMNSFGYANVFDPYTVITDSSVDDDGNESHINDFKYKKTNFSRGSGIYYINDDETSDTTKLYPWSNSALMDIAPTYQWDFWSTTKDENSIKEETLDGTKYRSKITSDGQLNGYYDYYDPYLKGNSIAIANGYDFNSGKNASGHLRPGKWGSGPYNWNIMGTNLQSNDYTISFMVKSSSEDTLGKDNDDAINNIAKYTKFVVTTSVDGSTPQVLKPTSIDESLDNGWYKISYNLNNISGISESNRIAKIGLQIDPRGNDSFIFNVGQFDIKNNAYTFDSSVNNNTEIDNIRNEYIVKRDSKSNNINIRFNWDVKNSEYIDYYEIYYKVDSKWVLLGQSYNNCYYVREIDESTNNDVTLGIRPVYKDSTSGSLYYGSFSTKYTIS